jgi:hypothetical protein
MPPKQYSNVRLWEVYAYTAMSAGPGVVGQTLEFPVMLGAVA